MTKVECPQIAEFCMRTIQRIVILSAVLVLAAIAEPIPAAASTTGGMEILDRTFARAETEERRFQPYRFRSDSHTWVRDAKDRLEYEGKQWVVALVPRPDETEVLESGEEVIFDAEAENEKEKKKEKQQKENGKDEKDEGGEHDMEAEFNFLDAEKRADYVYEFKGLSAEGDRSRARFDFRPRRNRKDMWRGSFWVDPETGVLTAVDVEPSKLRLGLKSLQIKGDMLSFGEMTVPAHLETRIEFKIPFLVHVKVRSVAEFSDYERVPEE